MVLDIHQVLLKCCPSWALSGRWCWLQSSARWSRGGRSPPKHCQACQEPSAERSKCQTPSKCNRGSASAALEILQMSNPVLRALSRFTMLCQSVLTQDVIPDCKIDSRTPRPQSIALQRLVHDMWGIRIYKTGKKDLGKSFSAL